MADRRRDIALLRSEEPTIRIATWNLWWRFGAWRKRAAAIRKSLQVAQPDLCALQEVWSEQGSSLASELADEFDMHWSWPPSPQPARWRSRLAGSEAEVGQAILSRWPIAERTELDLPEGGSGDESRNVLLCMIDGPGGRLPFASTQLTSDPSHSTARCKQVRALADLLVAYTHETYPVVLAGDMNAEPDSDEMRLLCGHKTAPAREGFVLVDAWRYAADGAVPWTWDRANPHVKATMEPSARIDYVLVGPPASDGAGCVRSARRIGEQPVDGIWPSDHAGALAELQMAAA